MLELLKDRVFECSSMRKLAFREPDHLKFDFSIVLHNFCSCHGRDPALHAARSAADGSGLRFGGPAAAAAKIENKGSRRPNARPSGRPGVRTCRRPSIQTPRCPASDRLLQSTFIGLPAPSCALGRSQNFSEGHGICRTAQKQKLFAKPL